MNDKEKRFLEIFENCFLEAQRFYNEYEFGNEDMLEFDTYSVLNEMGSYWGENEDESDELEDLNQLEDFLVDLMNDETHPFHQTLEKKFNELYKLSGNSR